MLGADPIGWNPNWLIVLKHWLEQALTTKIGLSGNIWFIIWFAPIPTKEFMPHITITVYLVPWQWLMAEHNHQGDDN